MQGTSDNKIFWKTIRPYFIDKRYNQTKTIIVERDSMITEKKKL